MVIYRGIVLKHWPQDVAFPGFVGIKKYLLNELVLQLFNHHYGDERLSAAGAKVDYGVGSYCLVQQLHLAERKYSFNYNCGLYYKTITIVNDIRK